jgi:HEAT repeat protein
MENEGNSFKQRVTGIIAFVSSLLVSIAGFFGAIEKVGGLQVFAIIMAALGLCWFGYLLYRYFKRRKHRQRMLYIGKEPGDTGFNEALPYTTNDAHRFYGRQIDTSNIMNQILQPDYRLGVLQGESGVGKTSIIQAGLIPELKKKNIQWGYISLNNLPRETGTSKDLMDFLVNRVSRAFELPECRSLEDIAKKLEKKQAGDSVVFLDQFEQIFDRTADNVLLEFAQRLEQFSPSNGRLKIVVIVREDYFSRVYNMFQQLERKAISTLYKFNLPQAREVIRKSAGYDEKLSETRPDDPLLEFEDEILGDLKDKDQKVHPVELSLICSTMMKVNGKLDARGYLNEGKKQGWLNRYLDDVLKGQPKRESLQLLSSLIHMDKAATYTAKEVAQKSGLTLAETRRLLEDFQQSRLIVTDVTGTEKEEKRYRLAHEYLIASIRIRSGDVETPVQKYGRLLNARFNAWEQENRNPHHLLKGKNLLRIRFRLRKYLCWDMDPLKKAFVRKSFSRYLIVMLPSFVIISALLTSIFFTVHSLKKGRLTEYQADLKLKESDELIHIRNILLRLSKESTGLKIKVLEEVLSADNKDLYKDEIMPVLFHTLIGISEDNRKKVVDYVLSNILPENVGKLPWLFTSKTMGSMERHRCQQMIFDILEKTRDTSTQKIIANLLGKIGDKKAVGPLNKLLESSNKFDVKMSAARALGENGIKSEKAVDYLIELLKHADDDVKRSAADALGKIGIKSEKAVEKLIELLKHPKDDVKLSAAVALVKIGIKSEKVVDYLIELLKHPEDFVKRSAADALVKIRIISKKGVDYLLELLKHPNDDVKSRVAEVLRKISIKSEKAVYSLIELLKHPKDDFKRWAAEELGEIGIKSEKAIEKLIELLKHPKDDVIIYTAYALGNIVIKSEKAVEKLIELLKHSNDDVKRRAAYALGKIGIKSEKAVDYLIELLKHPNDDVKLSAADALGNIGIKSEKAVEKLIEFLKHPNDLVIISAADALGKIGIKSEKAVEKLIELLKHPNDLVIISAADALGNIDIKDEKTIEKLIELSKHPNDLVKLSAAYALGKIGAPTNGALPGLKRLYEKEKNIKIKFIYLRTMLKIAPSNKEYLAIMIEELLPHPLVVLRWRWSYYSEEIKPLILKTIGEVAAKDEEGKKKVGKNLDFDGNMWTMLEWWKKYKEK